MKSDVDLDWMLERYYSGEESTGKQKLLEKLRDLWGESTRRAAEPEAVGDEVDYSSMTVAQLKDLLREAGKTVSGKKDELIERLQEQGDRQDIPNLRAPYVALNKLYDKYAPPDDDGRRDPGEFMIILLMTMRSRVVGEIDLEKKLDLSGPGLNGLRSLLKHWRKQQNDASELDVVCEFISSRHELRKPEYIVGALVEQVRRVRRGWKPGEDTHLEISDGLLHLAKQSVDMIPEESEVDDYNVVPNKHLKLFVEFQKILNRGKRPITARDLNFRLKNFLEKLDDPGVDFFTKDIYRWWAYYSLLRNSRRCMMPGTTSVRTSLHASIDGASDYEKELENVRKNMDPPSKQDWAEDLRSTGSVLRGITEGMEPIGEYHQGLAEFLNGERKLRTCAAPGGRRDMRDRKLYSTIVGGTGMRNNVRLFVNTKTIPVKRKEYKGKKGTKSSSCLIDYLDKSITNADLASYSVVSRSHLLAPVMLVLLATDLVVRFRWFAAPAQAAVFDEAKHLKRSDKSEIHKEAVRLKENHKEAVRLKKELIGVLENIQNRLWLVLNNLSPDPKQLIEGWISALKNLDLEVTKDNSIKLPAGKWEHTIMPVKLTALGQLSDACGKFVGWPWSHAWQGLRGVRKLPKGDPNNLELYVPQQNEPMVTLSLDDEGDYANHFAYVKPVEGKGSRA